MQGSRERIERVGYEYGESTDSVVDWDCIPSFTLEELKEDIEKHPSYYDRNSKFYKVTVVVEEIDPDAQSWCLRQ